MRGPTIRYHATRRLPIAVLTLALALPAAIWGGSFASTPSSTTAPYRAALQDSAAVQGPARVVDGDTIEINGTRVRLEGIDAPEGDQTCARAGGGTWRCGQAASVELERLIGRTSVRCESRGTDGYGRTLGICFVGAADINAQMVSGGFAWAFVKYSRAYVAEEADARARGVGIWQAPTTTAWDHRAGRWAAANDGGPGGCPIKGNITSNGRIYHMPWSPWYAKVRIDQGKGERWFCSENDAVAAGWRPVRVS